MKFQKRELIPYAIMGLMFIVAFIVYPYVQDPMITHWNAKGQPDGYTDKAIGLFLIPAIILIIYTLLQLIPKIEVEQYKKNIQYFYKYFFIFKLIFVLFIFGMYVTTLLPNLGYNIDILLYLMPAIAVFFLYTGYMMEKTKRNFFIGIRTPWTLSSDIVWKKTHQVGGKLFMLLALVALATIIQPEYMFYVFIISMLLVTAFVMIYSYFLYQRLPKKKKTRK